MSDDYINLLGTEQVKHASYQMEGAAESMRGSAERMEFAMRQHQQFLDDWLRRFEDAIESMDNDGGDDTDA